VILDIIASSPLHLVRQAAAILAAFKCTSHPTTVLPALGEFLTGLLASPDRHAAVLGVAAEVVPADYNLGPRFASALPALLPSFPAEVLEVAAGMATVYGGQFTATILPSVLASPAAYVSRGLPDAVRIAECALALALDPCAALVDFLLWALGSRDEAVVISAADAFLHLPQLAQLALPESLLPVLWGAIGDADEVVTAFSASARCLQLLERLLSDDGDALAAALAAAVERALASGDGVRAALRVLSVVQRAFAFADAVAVFAAAVSWLPTEHALDAAHCLAALAGAHAELRVAVADALFPLLPALPPEPRAGVELLLAGVVADTALDRDRFLPAVLALWDGVGAAEAGPLFFLTASVCEAVPALADDDPCVRAVLLLAQRELQSGDLDFAAAGFHLFTAVLPKIPALLPPMAECAAPAVARLLAEPAANPATPWMFAFFAAAARAAGDFALPLLEGVVRATPPFIAPDAPEDAAVAAWHFIAVALDCAPAVFGGDALDPIVRAVCALLDAGRTREAVFESVARVIDSILSRHAEELEGDILENFLAVLIAGLRLSLENAHPVRQALAAATVRLLTVRDCEVAAETLKTILQIVVDCPNDEHRTHLLAALRPLFGQPQEMVIGQGTEEVDLTGWSD
jgi:hypothetical protein